MTTQSDHCSPSVIPAPAPASARTGSGGIHSSSAIGVDPRLRGDDRKSGDDKKSDKCLLKPQGTDHTRQQNLKMISVADKAPTHRRAVAQGVISMGKDAFEHVMRGTLPKGEPFAMAEVAGILAAKGAPRTIPLCHPLLLDSIKVSFEKSVDQNSICVFCEVEATGKTGVEMEALAGVTGALLALYDVIKAVDPALRISGIRLKRKEGGKHGDWRHPEESDAISAPSVIPASHSVIPDPSVIPAKAGIHSYCARRVDPRLRGDDRVGGGDDGGVAAQDDERCAQEMRTLFSNITACVLTVSDRAKAGVYEDQSGPVLADWVRSKGATLNRSACVSDDCDTIRASVSEIIMQGKTDLLLITGGTGLGPRDQTPDVIFSLAKTCTLKAVPGIGEALRVNGSRFTPYAWLSRSVAVIANNTLIVALPGSPKALKEALPILESLLPHGLHTLKGGGHG